MIMNVRYLYSPYSGEIGLVKEFVLQDTCARIHMNEPVSIPAKCEMFVEGSTNSEFPHGAKGIKYFCTLDLASGY